MRIQMINSVHLELPGSRLIFNGGEFYNVDDALASTFISEKNAIDPDNPPVEIEPIQEQIEESITEELPEVTD